MKKLLGILVLGLLWCNSVYALDEETCAGYAAKAKTERAEVYIMGACIHQEGSVKSKTFKCAIKMGKANTEKEAVKVMRACIDSE